jgi:serine/threonine protein kinase
MVGTTLDNRYQIEEVLGEGRTGTLYRARDTALDRFVVVKVVREDLAQEEEFLNRLRRAAARAAGLAHPQVVSLYDAHLTAAPFYLVREYVPGDSLQKRLSPGLAWPVPEALRIAEGLCEALAYGHRRGLVHGDLRPANILLTESGEPKLADFGMAEALWVPPLAQSGLALSGAAYLSPEQVQEKALEPASDLYSLGVVLYEMLAGRVPFTAETPLAVGLKHVTEPPEPLRLHRPDVPPGVEQVVLQLLAKSPGDRPASAAAARAALEQARQALEEGPSAPTVEAVATEPTMALEPLDTELERIPARPSAPAPSLEATRVMAGPPPGIASPEPLAAAPRPQPPSYAGPGERGQPSRADRRSPLGPVFGAIVALAFLGALLWIGVLKPRVEAGKIPVPDLTGRTPVEARRILGERGLQMAIVGQEYSDKVAGGKVLSQVPPAAQKVEKGTEVQIILSRGPRFVTVPDLTGLTLEQAKRQLLKNGLVLGKKEEAEDPSKPNGRVIAQTPNAGRSVDKGTVVDLFVNKLPPPPKEPSTVPPEAPPEPGEGLLDTLKQEAQKKSEEMVDQAVEAGKEKLREQVEEGKERVREGLREGLQRMREAVTGGGGAAKTAPPSPEGNP